VSERDTRLKEELQAVGAEVRQLNPNMLLLRGVPTDPARFSKGQTNLLVVCTGNPRMPYLVLVDDDLCYGGEDPFLNQVFSQQPRAQGWRPLLLAPGHMTQSDLLSVARRALGFVGFPRPSLPEPPSGLQADWGFREAFPPLVGRDRLLQDAEALLSQTSESAGVVFLGPSGVGKSALAREMAWRWQERESGRLALRLTLPGVLADVEGPEARTRRLKGMYRDVLRLGPRALLVLDGLHLAWAGPLARLALCEAIEAGLRLCGTSSDGTPTFSNPALRRRLHVLTVPEPTAEELSEAILPTVARYLEVRHGLTIAPQTLGLALSLSRKQPGAQPGRALRILEGALSRTRGRNLSVLGPDDLFTDA
jgi:hypothetical protein